MKKHSTYIPDEFMPDDQILISYITDHLGDTVGTEYQDVQGRITVR